MVFCWVLFTQRASPMSIFIRKMITWASAPFRLFLWIFLKIFVSPFLASLSIVLVLALAMETDFRVPATPDGVRHGRGVPMVESSECSVNYSMASANMWFSWTPLLLFSPESPSNHHYLPQSSFTHLLILIFIQHNITFAFPLQNFYFRLLRRSHYIAGLALNSWTSDLPTSATK